MNEAYKTLVNHALERYHFRLAELGVKEDTTARELMEQAIYGLFIHAFASDDKEAQEELKSIVAELFNGSDVIEPYYSQVAA
ncbi:DUF4754 family protein [Escherichia coli]|nr:DUF4754 family protein [Escherichia coli]